MVFVNLVKLEGISRCCQREDKGKRQYRYKLIKISLKNHIMLPLESALELIHSKVIFQMRELMFRMLICSLRLSLLASSHSTTFLSLLFWHLCRLKQGALCMKMCRNLSWRMGFLKSKSQVLRFLFFREKSKLNKLK